MSKHSTHFISYVKTPKCQRNVHLLYTTAEKCTINVHSEINRNSTCLVCAMNTSRLFSVTLPDAHYTLHVVKHMFAIIYLSREVFTVREMNVHVAS